ncbi:MAG: protein kinase, partial [bacterium]
MSALKVIDEKYEIRDEIKRGGFGVIYQGVDLLFGKPVAIKAVEPTLLHEAKYIDMFQAEALSIARLNHHNIVHIYDIKRDTDGQFYIVMEYIDGCDLAQLIFSCRKTVTPIPLHLGVYIVAEACAGLDYAHNRRDSETNDPLNVVHQDISPSNIMITKSGEVKVIDFGMAKFYRKQVLKKNEVSIQGKLNYLAPEQLNGAANIDRRTDIFALGLVLYEVITGERFFNANDPQKNIELLRSNKWDFSKIENDEIPKKLREVIHKSLKAKTDERYPSANHMYMDLMHFLILAAPAADFVGELSEFMKNLDVEKADEKETGHSELQSANNHVPVVETHEKLSQEINKTKSRRNKKQRGKSRRNGAQAPRKDAEKTVPEVTAKVGKDADETTSDSEATSEFMKISDKAVEEMDAAAGPVNIESKAGAEKSEVITEEGLEPQQDNEKSENVQPDLLTPTDEQELPDSEKDSDDKDDTKDLSTESFDQADMAKFLSQDDQSEASVVDESIATSTEIKPERRQQRKGTSAEFYSIIDDNEDEEELKTIIDVVRLSARSHKKGIIITLLSLILLFAAYSVVDTFMQITSYGTFIYDFVSPPAIKISSIPSGAQVYMDDKPLQQTTPVRIEEIDPGVHKLMLVLPRFEPIIKSINVPSEGNLQIAGEDDRNPWEDYLFQFKTQLELSSNPPDADIYINGVKLAQMTPATVLWDVAEEPIQITLAKPGFPNLAGVEINTLEGVENIADRRFWKFQRLDRTKDHFAIEGVFRKTVEIGSTPSKAEIYINDEERPVGITDLNGTLLLPVGQHAITLRKNGYLARKFTITVDENTKPRYTQVLSRKVRVFAKDAASLDNSDIGAMLVELRTRRRTTPLNNETPTEITLLPYRYTAVLRRQGYKETFVQIAPTDRIVVARMEPETAQVTFFIIDEGSNEPVNASQVLWQEQDQQSDEQQLGITDASGTVTGKLPPGNYQFSVIKPGYEIVTRNL